MSVNKPDSISVYGNSVKSWPHNLISSSLTYTASSPSMMSLSNSIPIQADSQKAYVNTNHLPIQQMDSRSDSVYLTKRLLFYWFI